MDDNLGGGAWSRRSSGNDEGKFKEAMGMVCSSLQVEEMYPVQEKALRAFLKEMIFSSVFFFFPFFFLISSPLQNLIRFTTTQHYCFPVTHDPTMSMTSNCWHTTKSCKMYKSAARETLHSRVPRTL